MWLSFARAPPPDAPYWPGRRWLAAVDAVAWPLAIVSVVFAVPGGRGLLQAFSVALLVLSAGRRIYTALAANHRYHVTTWRWARLLAVLLTLGALIKVLLE